MAACSRSHRANSAAIAAGIPAVLAATMASFLGFALALLAVPVAAQSAAERFGARQAVTALRLSPDGSRVAYIAPAQGQGSALMIRGTGPDDPEKPAMMLNGDPQRINWCQWISNDRLACEVYGLIKRVDILPFSRLIAINADGKDMQILSARDRFEARGAQLYGGDIIDWLPDDDDAVLMIRNFVPNDRIGSRTGSSDQGLGVDRVETRTLRASRAEKPRTDANEYISDGRGTVRIMGVARFTADGYASGVTQYMFRLPGEREWKPLASYDVGTREGFYPYAVDPDRNVAYGIRKSDGRFAFMEKALDGTGTEKQIVARPDVDVTGLIRIGRNNRVVGTSYTTDVGIPVYFDPAVSDLMNSLAKALPDTPLLRVVDSSQDENILLIWAGADNDPGVHYIFDRKRGELRTFLVSRPQLEGMKLATVKPVTYPARDGVQVPGYLTLPPGMDSARGLPALVLPHGGPSARDVWGFDWLSHYFAHQGYAVLRPNFRGSSGYGDAWFQNNGFQSWRTAIADVADAGHWLVKQGIADPEQLGIFGWSYGGYAALQTAAMEPDLFRAVVAVAPVTDLEALKEQERWFGNYRVVSDFIGAGPHLREGSPTRSADRINAPVLMFHGGLDRNVLIGQSEMMAGRLQSAGKEHRLVTWDKLDHYLDDSEARATMLRQSDSFLKQAFAR